MSDVPVAPQGATAPSAAPANEVVINPKPDLQPEPDWQPGPAGADRRSRGQGAPPAKPR